MDRYQTNNKGLAPAMSDILNEYGNSPRSTFDKSSRKSIDISPFYIIPIDLIKLLPNTDVNVSYDIQVINKNPTIRRMLGSMHLELRAYRVKDSDCWEGHNNFVTCGRSGKVFKEIPRIKWRLASGKTTCLPYNPYFTLNIAPARYFAKATESNPSRPWSFDANQGLQDVSDCQDSGLTLIPAATSEDITVMHDISALPAVFYTKIVKEYQNPNLLQDNPYWYPENENHDLILPYTLPNSADSVTNSSFDDCTVEFYSGSGDTQPTSITPTNDAHSRPWLNVLYRCQRKGNMFNTGSPFPDLLRGDVPTLQILNANIDWTNVFGSGSQLGALGLSSNNTIGLLQNSYAGSGQTTPVSTLKMSARGNKVIMGEADSTTSFLTVASSDNLLSAFSKATISGIQFSMKAWRSLAVQSLFREKMARTDGSYNQMIMSQFGINPKWHEHSVDYVGGSYQPIVFSEVTQTSADASSPLGTTAGKFVSANQSNQIKFHSDDFGMMMTVVTLVPDDYYCQGINRLWSSLSQEDIPFPIRNNLDPQALLNKELLVSGVNNTDNDVFNYVERYSEWKSDRNEISGLLALPISKVGDIGTFFFNRLLSSNVNFNWNFVEGHMTDNENLVFSSTEQAQFILSIARRKSVTYPLPAISRPSDMGLSYA